VGAGDRQAVSPTVRGASARGARRAGAKGVTGTGYSANLCRPLSRRDFGDMNRTDSFGFSVPERYLVICNVRGHFVDGMYAFVNVLADDDH